VVGNSDRPDILVLPPVLVGGLLLVGVVVHYWVWTVTPFPIVPARILGAVLLVSAGVLANAAHSVMKRAGTNILPTQPALALVRDGPFRRTRNPLYIAAVGVYLGVAFWVDGLVPFLLLPLVLAGLHWAVVMPEERYLEGKFGDAYRTYRSQVPRWLWRSDAA
jgi:protein-S-isoprenylcysteine O-methyltransferase Ste14